MVARSPLSSNTSIATASGVKALSDWLFAARKAVIALLVSAALINFLGFYTKTNQDFSRASVTLGLLFSAALLVALRRLQTLYVGSDLYQDGK